MMTTDTAKATTDRARIKGLKQQLSILHKEKEELFKSKETVSTQIRTLISDVKSLKSKRNTLTDDVAELKKERKILNQQIRDRVEEVKKLRETAKKSQTKDKKSVPPAKIREQINKLEYTLETGAVSFDKERKLNVQIKDLRKQLGAIEETTVDWGKINQMSKDIDKMKVRADEVHVRIQTEAKDSQSQHEVVLQQSKGIDALKTEEDRLQKEFKKKKKEYTKVMKELKELEPEAKPPRDFTKKIQKAEIDSKALRKLADKKVEVEEKMMRGEKLTTEDLLILQGPGQ